MNTIIDYNKLVAKIFESVSHCKLMPTDDYSGRYFITFKNHHILINEKNSNGFALCVYSVEYYEKIFEDMSLDELRDILFLLSLYVDKGSYDTNLKLKIMSTFQYIDSQIIHSKLDKLMKYCDYIRGNV